MTTTIAIEGTTVSRSEGVATGQLNLQPVASKTVILCSTSAFVLGQGMVEERASVAKQKIM